MATIGRDEELGLKQVMVNPERLHIGDTYFKSIIEVSKDKKGYKLGRFSFTDSRVFVHNSNNMGYRPLKSNEVNSKMVKRLREFMSNQNKDFLKYTNWDVAKYYWNYEYDLIPQGIDDYMEGIHDNISHGSYVPSTQEIQITWGLN